MKYTGGMSEFTHLNAEGEANMVDVSAKAVTHREAVAVSTVTMKADTLAAISAQQIAKGEVLAVARIAGIQAAKRCADLIPLCHPLALTKVSVDFEQLNDTQLQITGLCRVSGQTGVEMEALTAVSVAALTIYDMCKAMDKGMVISDTCLVSKRGGKSGDFDRAAQHGGQE